MLTSDARHRNARQQRLLDHPALEFQAVPPIATAPIANSFDRPIICVHDLLCGHNANVTSHAIMVDPYRPVQTVLG